MRRLRHGRHGRVDSCNLYTSCIRLTRDGLRCACGGLAGEWDAAHRGCGGAKQYKQNSEARAGSGAASGGARIMCTLLLLYCFIVHVDTQLSGSGQVQE